MRTLIEKFPDGYEVWAQSRGEIPAPPPEKRSSAPSGKAGPVKEYVVEKMAQLGLDNASPQS
jgi:hypothetical protein